jgi:hypothetical protein
MIFGFNIFFRTSVLQGNAFWLFKDLTYFHVMCNLKFSNLMVLYLKIQVGVLDYFRGPDEVLHGLQAGGP